MTEDEIDEALKTLRDVHSIEGFTLEAQATNVKLRAEDLSLEFFTSAT